MDSMTAAAPAGQVPRRFVTVKQAAATLGISTDRVERAFRKGQLPGYQLGPNEAICLVADAVEEKAGLVSPYGRILELLGQVTPAQRTEIAKAALTWQEGGRG